jgi:hypothetical protein
MDKESAIKAFRRENRAMPLSQEARSIAITFIGLAVVFTMIWFTQSGTIPQAVWLLLIGLSLLTAMIPVFFEKIVGKKPNRTLVFKYSPWKDLVGSYVREE